MDRNLEDLMALYQAGDFAAARCLIERVSPPLHRFLAAQAASRPDADDLLQEVWLRIHRVRHTYRIGGPLLPWIYAIARHVRVDHYRRSLRTTVREYLMGDIAQSAYAPQPASLQADELEELLAPLPESQREVLEMVKVAGMSLEEVARATSSSVGSVKQKVHRAYKTLRQTIGLVEMKKGNTGAVP